MAENVTLWPEIVRHQKNIARVRDGDAQALPGNVTLRPEIVRIEKKIARDPALIVTVEELIARDMKFIV